MLSIVITLAGGIALFTLPVAQYPEITPPTVEVSAVYPGANAQVVADTVAAPIEQQVNGVEDMMYMSSQCTNDGTYTLTVTFKLGIDLNMAQVLVQNRVSLAEPILPDLVKRRGVTVKKKSPSMLMIVNLFSPDSSRDNLYLSNYATIQLRDELSRLPGVGDITYLGQRDYSMRVWLDPREAGVPQPDGHRRRHGHRAAEHRRSPPARSASRRSPTGQVFQFTITHAGPADRRRAVRRHHPQDRRQRPARPPARRGPHRARRPGLRPVLHARRQALGRPVDLPAARLQRPGDRRAGARPRWRSSRTASPTGVDYAIVYDTTPFINESVNEVFKTLRDAVILVAIVVLLFLQNWRSAHHPADRRAGGHHRHLRRHGGASASA